MFAVAYTGPQAADSSRYAGFSGTHLQLVTLPARLCFDQECIDTLPPMLGYTLDPLNPGRFLRYVPQTLRLSLSQSRGAGKCRASMSPFSNIPHSYDMLHQTHGGLAVPRVTTNTRNITSVLCLQPQTNPLPRSILMALASGMPSTFCVSYSSWTA
jgi:hypothetical protein